MFNNMISSKIDAKAPSFTELFKCYGAIALLATAIVPFLMLIYAEPRKALVPLVLLTFTTAFATMQSLIAMDSGISGKHSPAWAAGAISAALALGFTISSGWSSFQLDRLQQLNAALTESRKLLEDTMVLERITKFQTNASQAGLGTIPKGDKDVADSIEKLDNSVSKIAGDLALERARLAIKRAIQSDCHASSGKMLCEIDTRATANLDND